MTPCGLPSGSPFLESGNRIRRIPLISCRLFRRQNREVYYEIYPYG